MVGRHDVGFVSQTGRGTWIGLWGDIEQLGHVGKKSWGGGYRA